MVVYHRICLARTRVRFKANTPARVFTVTSLNEVLLLKIFSEFREEDYKDRNGQSLRDDDYATVANKLFEVNGYQSLGTRAVEVPVCC